MEHEIGTYHTMQEKTPEYPGIPGLLIPVGFAQGQECAGMVLLAHAGGVYVNHKCKRHLVLYGCHPKHADRTSTRPLRVLYKLCILQDELSQMFSLNAIF